MVQRYKDITGEKFGNWTVVSLTGERGPRGTAKWLCKCDCGTEKPVLGTNLRNGSSKSCGCIPAGIKPSGLTPYKRIFRAICHGAMDRGFDMKVTFEEFMEMAVQPCHYCGKEPYDTRYSYNRQRYSKGEDKDEAVKFNSLDRVDSDGGYVAGNVVPCCSMCNRMKSDFTTERFYEQIMAIANNLKENNNDGSKTQTGKHSPH